MGRLDTDCNDKLLLLLMSIGYLNYMLISWFAGIMGRLHTACNGRLLVLPLCTYVGDRTDTYLHIPVNGHPHSIRSCIAVHEGK